MNGLFEEIDSISAAFSPDYIYRYTLTRRWSDGRCVAWLMANPSTATAEDDDPTIRRCISFSQRWGYGRLVILNLYAVRNPDPRVLRRVTDPVGPMNDWWIEKALADEGAREVVCAWGCAQHLPNVEARIQTLLRDTPDGVTCFNRPAVCLGYRKDGHPRHPLMVRGDTPHQPFMMIQPSGRGHKEES